MSLRLDNLLNVFRTILPLALIYPLAASAQLLNPPIADEELVEEELPPRYSIEIIVFEYAAGAAGGNEIFEPELPPEAEIAADGTVPIDATAIDAGTGEDAPVFSDKPLEDAPLPPEEVDPFYFENFVLAEIPSLTGIGFEMLPPEQFSMVEIHEKLVNLDAYQPLLWSGWIQQAVDEETTLPISLRELGRVPLGVDGSLKLYLKNYLHLVVDLSMSQRISTIEAVYPQQKTQSGYDSPLDSSYVASDYQTIIYEIVEDRIFRSGQLRYFDHPRFGVLARVMRLEEGEEEPLPEDDLLPPAESLVGS